DVRTPALLPPCARHLPPHRRLHPMGRRRRAPPGLGREPLHPPGTPPPRPALLLPRVPVTPPPGGHPTHTLVRRVGGWLRPPRPQRERLCPLPLRLVVGGGPGPPPQGTLPGTPQVGLRRLAPHPLVLRAPCPLFFSPSPMRRCVARCGGITGRGLPPGRARVVPVVP